MAQAGRGVLHGHGPGQAEAFLERDVRRHAQPADRRAGGDVVDHQDAAQADLRLGDMNHQRRSKIVGKGKHVGHGTASSEWFDFLLCTRWPGRG